MSNEEYIEELIYNVHKSGEFNKFIEKVQKNAIKHPNKQLNQIREEVYHKMVKKGNVKA